ncbi:hypothetical protein HaLaN_11121 [Haematococcus lacustris]|uniref:Uncharacterized protein n=1 Tax=Haematococcus lacustris TaxID=44745 RepID=A0A699Z6P4_HAELA|nr:hypothetical protein HaLaN_11121 [Haematococcus lacustris]
MSSPPGMKTGSPQKGRLTTASAGPDSVPGSGTTQAPTGPMQQPGSHMASSFRARAQHSPASQAHQAHQCAPSMGV